MSEINTDLTLAHPMPPGAVHTNNVPRRPRVLSGLLNSPAACAFYGSMVFWADKRPITVDPLRRLSLAKLAAEAGRTVEYERHAPATPPRNQAPRGKANRAKDGHPALPM